MQKNFKYLDDLIHSGAKEMVLDSDIVLSDDEESEYKYGIRLDVDDLAIDGNGYEIDAQGKTRIFCCTGKNITIENIFLKNGFAETGGAICNWKGGSLTIIQSALKNNAAEGIFSRGGAIFNKGEMTITESILTQNTSHHVGGAIFNHGELAIIGSVLTKNTARNGGAICNEWYSLTITGSTLTENTAQGPYLTRGGAIYNEGGNIKISESTLNNNTAKMLGGAICNWKEGKLTITESTVDDNRANLGAAIYSDNQSKMYKYGNCTFRDNDVYEERD